MVVTRSEELVCRARALEARREEAQAQASAACPGQAEADRLEKTAQPKSSGCPWIESSKEGLASAG